MHPWHSIPHDQILHKLETSLHGLSDEEVQKRLNYYGPNTLPESSGVHPLKVLLSQFTNPLVIILLLAAFFAFILQEFIDATVIMIIVIVNSAIGFWQELKAERAIESLKHMSAQYTNVVRNGKAIKINSHDLVPGDIVQLNSGDKVGADMLLIESHHLKVNESLLTGESSAIEKNITVHEEETPLADRTNMVFSGTIVEHGRGLGVVVNTGEHTEIGKIASLVSKEKKNPTPLQQRLGKLAGVLGKVSLGIIIPVVLVSIYRGETFFHIFSLGVSLAVSAVPEGLAVVVTIALSIGIKRMLWDKALARRLPVVEVLGNTDVICTDKTGTLTTNQMTLTHIYTKGRAVSFNSEAGVLIQTAQGWQLFSDQDNPRTPSKITDRESNILSQLVLCSDAGLNTGDPTEIALVKQATNQGVDADQVRAAFPRIEEIPFSSEYKYMVTVHEQQGLIAKGSVEQILHMTDKVLDEANHIQPLSEEEKQAILELNNQLALQGRRVLALAQKPHPDKHIDHQHLSGLTFLGLISLQDPPRLEVRDAIQQCYQAGINIIMITGDHALTAKAIAKEVGIRDGKTLTGVQLDELSDEELMVEVEEATVFARVTSEHKLRILKALQANGHITAMGGDGVNDAPALKKADIGFSVGSGTDLAKEVADMILLDDNFATIPKAIKEGRVIFQNIRNFLKLMLSSNFDEIVVVTFCVIMGIPVMYIPIHILWINLLSDGLPASSLAFDSAADDVMHRKPTPQKNALFVNLTSFIVVSGILSLLASVISFSLFYSWWDLDSTTPDQLAKARTAILTASVLFEMVQVFICRTHKFAFSTFAWKNKYLLGAVSLSFILLILTIYVPGLNTLFKTVPLYASDWLKILIPTITTLWILEVFKLIYYKNRYF